MKNKKIPYLVMLLYVVGLALTGMIIGDVRTTFAGLFDIVTSPAGLITDWIAVGGFDAAFINASLVTLVTVVCMYFSDVPLNGMDIATLGMMSGYGFFGKNIFNILPIIIGGFIQCRISKAKPSEKCCGILLSGCMGPLVSFIAFGTSHGANLWTILLSWIVGTVIGFVGQCFSGEVLKFQHGMSLYNVGLFAGLLMAFCSALCHAFGEGPEIVLIWSTEYSDIIFAVCMIFSAVLIILGLFCNGIPVKEAIRRYGCILKNKADDNFISEGAAACFINCGVNGIFVCLVLRAIGGNFCGPTLAGILSVIGFSAKGKDLRTIWSPIAGIILGALVMPGIELTAPGVQLAILFVTACAPFVSEFGWFAGLAAGFVHCFLVAKTGVFTGGFNLYNNGFAIGLTVCMLYPVCMQIRSIVHGQKPSGNTGK